MLRFARFDIGVPEKNRETRDAEPHHVYRSRLPVRPRLCDAAPDALPPRSGVRDLGQNARIRHRSARPSPATRRGGNVCALLLPQGPPTLVAHRRLRACGRSALSERRSPAPRAGSGRAAASRAVARDAAEPRVLGIPRIGRTITSTRDKTGRMLDFRNWDGFALPTRPASPLRRWWSDRRRRPRISKLR